MSGSTRLSASPTTISSSGSISKAVAGVIGAMATLAVILGVEGLILLVGGLRLVSKSSLAASGAATQGAATGVKE